MAQADFLTGFLSKEDIDSTLDKIRAECAVDKRPFSILVIDLDHFKTYNDKYGHLDGDDVLKYFSSTLRLSLKDIDTYIFRFGGDEFIIVFPGKHGKDTYSVAQYILRILKKRPFLSRGRIFKLSFSGGIASFPADGRDIEGIIAKADKAMYFSKTHGRARTTLYRSILHKTIERLLQLSVVILLAGGTFFYFQQTSYKDYAMGWLMGKIGKLSVFLTPPSARVDAKDLRFVYLKSGRILKGVIIRDDKDEIEFSLVLEEGKGSVTIRRSDITRIEKQTKD